MIGEALTHTLELTAMVHSIAKVPDLKERQSRMSQGRPHQLGFPAAPHKHKRLLLTLTAPPIWQQVMALPAAALCSPKGADTLMLAAVVPEAAVVNGWWKEETTKCWCRLGWRHPRPQSGMLVMRAYSPLQLLWSCWSAKPAWQ